MSDNTEQFLRDIMEEQWPGSPKAILENALRKWFTSRRPYPLLGALSHTEDGQRLVTYDSKQYDIDNGYGEFVCRFIPLAAVEKIAEECGRIYDECAADYQHDVLSDPEWQRISRAEAVEAMAEIATRRLLIGLGSRLCYAVEDSLDESLFLAKVVIQGALKSFLEGEQIGERELVDCRRDIVEAAEKVSRREREVREGLITHNVPRVRISVRGGSDPLVEVLDAQCVAISEDYPALLKHWQSVRKLRDSNPAGNWRGYAKLDQSDTPDELLERLNDPDPYASQPNVLAHHHAAHRHGIPIDAYSPQSLSRLRRRGDQIRNQSNGRID